MIKINKDWSVAGDDFSVTLYCNKKIKTTKNTKNVGGTKTEIIGYYNNYQDALMAMVNKDIQNIDTTFVAMVKRLNELEVDIKKAVPKILKEIK